MPRSNLAYDSRPDTHEHIEQVRELLSCVILDLGERSEHHDASKLVDPERAVFDEYTPKLRSMTYGSAEYKSALEGMGEGLRHHYAENRHHPEHHPDGIAGMTLADVVEMLADWKAATLRHADGDLVRSIEHNAARFGYGQEMKRLLVNTARAYGWVA